jgi:hypothetical protein
MDLNKKAIAIFGLLGFMIIGIAATTKSEKKSPRKEFKNLQILPKDISPDLLDKVMDEFTAALGVKCNFCHTKSKDTLQEMDFASDEKPEKLIARKMIDMANKINENFFEGKSKYGEVNSVLEVRCITCHHGVPHPGDEEEGENKKQ